MGTTERTKAVNIKTCANATVDWYFYFDFNYESGVFDALNTATSGAGPSLGALKKHNEDMQQSQGASIEADDACQAPRAIRPNLAAHPSRKIKLLRVHAQALMSGVLWCKGLSPR